MGLDDLFGFDAAAYKCKVQSLTTPQLKARELEKTRQILTNSVAGGASLGAAFATGGSTLIFTGLNLRKIDIAKKKLDLIVAELQRRNVELKTKITGKDKALAIVCGLTGVVAGDIIGSAIGGDWAASDVAGGGEALPHLATEQIAGSLAGGSVQCAMTLFENQESWGRMIQSVMGCSRLGGTESTGLFCNGCQVHIQAGLYARRCLPSLIFYLFLILMGL